MKIAIRADGGSKIGMGHIMRTSVLAESLSRFAEILYVCKTGSEFEAGREFVASKGYRVIQIEDEQILRGLSQVECDCFISDSYDVDEKYFKQTKRMFAYTGYIDDLNLYEFDVDFLINQNIYAEDLDYRVNPDTKLFLGTKYALLRSEFQNLSQRRVNKTIKDVMITVGGSDPHNITGDIVNKVRQAYPHFSFNVVVGPSFPYKCELERMDSSNIRLYYNAKMSDLMLQSDLVITACGSTIYEVVACGTPAIGFLAADNQRMAAEKMDSLDIIFYAKNSDEILEGIKYMNFEKRQKASQTAQRLVDGKGSNRVAEGINDVVKI